jgi:transcriptional regulator of acetoin/glycerol metabolism
VLGLSDDTDRVEGSSSGVRQTELVLRGILPGDSILCRIGTTSLKIGRGEDCELRLDAKGVSRHHAEIYRQGPLCALRDLGSTNGTWVDGASVPHGPLRSGAIVRFGDWLGMIDEVDAARSLPAFGQLTPGVFGGGELARALDPLKRVAPTELPVVLVGATGTGKECFARTLHALSGREGPFYALNCAALSPGLAEGELFGHEKGAFTGAYQAQIGHLRAAHGGTLFLDEVADLPVLLQAKLLRALEQMEVTPVGATRAQKLDTRVVVASQWPLDVLVEKGQFREDFASRLAGLVVTIPSLAERRADIPKLFHRFVLGLTGGRPPELCVKLLERLCLHSWPGNVRELSLLARQMLALQGLEPRLRRSHLPPALRGALVRNESSGIGFGMSPRDDERTRLAAALRESAGQVAVAAAKLGISRQRAYRLMSSAELAAVRKLANGRDEDATAD